MLSGPIKEPADAPRAGKPHNIALGLERIGLISLHYPVAVAIVAVLLSLAAAVGVTRLKVDDSLSQLFRSETPEFKQYEEVSRRFPSSEYDVLIVVEGKTLLARPSLMKLRDLVTDVQLVDGVKGIISCSPRASRRKAASFPLRSFHPTCRRAPPMTR